MVSQLLAITTHQLAVVIAVFADSCENPPGYSRGSCIGSLVSEGVECTYEGVLSESYHGFMIARMRPTFHSHYGLNELRLQGNANAHAWYAGPFQISCRLCLVASPSV
jgi:hypothetical protein